MTTGDLISQLDVSVTAKGGNLTATMGGTLATVKGQDLEVTIRFVDNQKQNRNGDNPAVTRVDLIRGRVTGPATDRANDRNASSRVQARFQPSQWTPTGDTVTIKYTLTGVTGSEYIRVRGTNTNELEPLPDPSNEDPWSDLWFYSNPIFITPR